MRMGHW